jgi:hypothetical protein
MRHRGQQLCRKNCPASIRLPATSNQDLPTFEGVSTAIRSRAAADSRVEVDLIFGNTINPVRHDLDIPMLIVRPGKT